MSIPHAIADTRPTGQRVTGAIASAAARTGVNFDYLYNQARIESSLDPQARAKTSSATGLFQFTRQTWLATLKEHGAEHELGWAADAISQGADGKLEVSDPAMRDAIFGLRDQPEAASAMAAAFAQDNGNHLASQLGRPIESVDLYLAHFLGPAGAVKFLSAHAADPNASGAALLPQAAAANPGIFYGRDGHARSVDEIRTNFAKRLDGATPGPVQFAQSWASQPATQAPPQSDGARFTAMRAIEPMPQRLSLDFARQAYQRLSSLNGRGA